MEEKKKMNNGNQMISYQINKRPSNFNYILCLLARRLSSLLCETMVTHFLKFLFKYISFITKDRPFNVWRKGGYNYIYMKYLFQQSSFNEILNPPPFFYPNIVFLFTYSSFFLLFILFYFSPTTYFCQMKHFLFIMKL